MILRSFCLLISLASLLSYSDVYSQSNLTYVGSYKVADYEGRATFKYKYVLGDTILDGRFQLENASIHQLLSSKDKHFMIQGNFSEGVPTGSWRFALDNFQLADSEDVIVRDYQYNVKVNGVHHEVYGNLINGKPNNEWVHHIQKLKSSTADQSLFKSSINFNKGVPQKSFRIENEAMILVGRFLNDGIAHDLWELFSLTGSDATERWRFENGILKSIEWQKEDSSRRINIYNDLAESTEIINLDRKYLQILSLNHLLTSTSPISWESRISDLLDENASHYKTIDQIISAFGNESFMPEFKVKVYNNPLTENEISELKSIYANYKKTEEITKRILNSASINLLKLADERVLFLAEVIEKINSKHLEVIRKVSDYGNQGLLSYVPRNELLTKLWADSTDYKSISVNYEMGSNLVSKKFIGDAAKDFSLTSGGIKDAYLLSEYVYATTNQIESEINSKLTKEQREQELIALEEQLYNDVTQLNTLIDSLAETVVDKPQSSLNRVKQVVKTELATYSKLENMSAKTNQANALNDCMVQMTDLSLTIANMPARNDEINQLYTDRVWNPFTSTLMDELVKKRIITAYSDILQPYIFEQIMENLNCENSINNLTLNNELHQRMLELREEDTDKLERKLKREKDPLAILTLFNVNNSTSLED